MKPPIIVLDNQRSLQPFQCFVSIAEQAKACGYDALIFGGDPIYQAWHMKMLNCNARIRSCSTALTDLERLIHQGMKYVPLDTVKMPYISSEQRAQDQVKYAEPAMTAAIAGETTPFLDQVFNQDPEMIERYLAPIQARAKALIQNFTTAFEKHKGCIAFMTADLFTAIYEAFKITHPQYCSYIKIMYSISGDVTGDGPIISQFNELKRKKIQFQINYPQSVITQAKIPQVQLIELRSAASIPAIVQQLQTSVFTQEITLPASVSQPVVSSTMRCAGCAKLAVSRCSACQQVYYCSPVCQKTNWPTHKIICQSIAAAKKQP